MHLIMILTALIIACGLRLIPVNTNGNWQQRWQRSLFLFLFPPLILITTVLATLLMGARGKMLGMQASWFSYWLGFIFIFGIIFYWCKLAYKGWCSLRKIKTYPQKILQNKLVRFINIDLPYIAQIGFWQPELVVSKGLLNILDKEQIEAVLAHEQAHLEYRDTFCFFWLGWLRSCTFWLNNTDFLWEELLLLREIRADLAAAKTVDALTLAESLVTVAQSSLQPYSYIEVGFSLPSNNNRLTQRIEALINNASLPASPNFIYWSWLFLVFIPLATIPFHC
jgi:Zn-dependent protease with chaperone function